MIPVVLIILIFNFFLIHLSPGDPALIMCGDYVYDQSFIENTRKEWGLDKPILTQLTIYLNNVIHLDLGYSYIHHQPVIEVIAAYLPKSLMLLLTSQFIGIFLGISLSIYAVRRFNSKIDKSISLFLMVTYSVPIFWFGLILIILFCMKLSWFPIGGFSSIVLIGQNGSFLDILWHLILPVTCLSLCWTIPAYFRITRASLIEVMDSEYIRTARCTGLKEQTIFYKHALRNAILPTITMAGLYLGMALGGALMTETVFIYPGTGFLMYQSISQRNYPLIMGIFLISSVATVLASFFTDITYAYLDPRISYK